MLGLCITVGRFFTVLKGQENGHIDLRNIPRHLPATLHLIYADHFALALPSFLQLSSLLVAPYRVPYRTIRYHAIPYHTHTVPYHAMPYHTIPYRTVPYHTIPYHTIPYRTIPHHTIPYHTTHTVPRRIILYHMIAFRFGPFSSYPNRYYILSEYLVLTSFSIGVKTNL